MRPRIRYENEPSPTRPARATAFSIEDLERAVRRLPDWMRQCGFSPGTEAPYMNGARTLVEFLKASNNVRADYVPPPAPPEEPAA